MEKRLIIKINPEYFGVINPEFNNLNHDDKWDFVKKTMDELSEKINDGSAKQIYLNQYFRFVEFSKDEATDIAVEVDLLSSNKFEPEAVDNPIPSSIFSADDLEKSYHEFLQLNEMPISFTQFIIKKITSVVTSDKDMINYMINNCELRFYIAPK